MSAETGEPSTKLKKGVETPQSAYQCPILSTWVALGSEADVETVIERVHVIQAYRLNAYDLAAFADGRTVRWVNTAHWARNAMREEGLLRGRNRAEVGGPVSAEAERAGRPRSSRAPCF